MTANEMRIGDGSSDVFSSDLDLGRGARRCRGQEYPGELAQPVHDPAPRRGRRPEMLAFRRATPVLNTLQAIRFIPMEEPVTARTIGRVSCRETVCQTVWVTLVAGNFKKNDSVTIRHTK